MMRRSRAREVALQVLYQTEVNPGTAARDRVRFLKGRLRSGALVEFAESLVDGVGRHREAIDAVLEDRSRNWRVARMAATDRAVLRLAVFELRHTDTPGPVVVDEAIELARRYGNEASPRFVAGILGSLLAAGNAAADPASPVS
jgi:N utilization substance protein B